MSERLEFAQSMFSGKSMHGVFRRLAEIFPIATMTASPTPMSFVEGEPLTLPETYRHESEEKSTEAFLSLTDTVALVVIQDGRMRLERYALSGGERTHWTSMSVAKSFTSAALGIAAAEAGLNIEDDIAIHLPELKGSAYDGARIRDVLQMSSGARWNEDYSDPDSDINRFIEVFAVGGSFNALAARLKRQREPGTFNLYNSIDTQVLGMLLTKVTGRPIRDYMEEKLWHPLGMESDGHWLVDSDGMEMAYGGLQATARDFAKIGELFRNGGNWRGKQIVPASWVKASVTPDAPHLMPGKRDTSDSAFGYGYQWWLMDGEEGEFSAIGVYNQFVYVNPARKLVVTKLSASPDYGQTNDERTYREFETVELFRAIGRSL
ncbi:MAG: serine hydrolase domain-containing protein [Rhizobiaceae bacterium]